MISALSSHEFGRRDPEPKVTVCVVTYNQKDFIGQCLQSLIDQKTDFHFEIIVGDDCSTDGTSEIVANLAKSHPDRIFHQRHDANIGAYRNYIHVHAWAAKRGCQYIAHVDGDDAALPGKLQAQADILDQHPDVALSAHAVRVMGRTQNIGDADKLPEYATLNDLLMFGAYFVNSSTMYRAVNHVPRTEGQDVVDFYLYVEQAGSGSIHLNKKILGEYRWHDLGISKSPAHRERIENAYAAAFALARQIGANPEVVERSRLKRQMSFAIAALVDQKPEIFRKKIQLHGQEWLFSTAPHKILCAGRHLVQGAIKKIIVRKYTGT